MWLHGRVFVIILYGGGGYIQTFISRGNVVKIAVAMLLRDLNILYIATTMVAVDHIIVVDWNLEQFA